MAVTACTHPVGLISGFTLYKTTSDLDIVRAVRFKWSCNALLLLPFKQHTCAGLLKHGLSISKAYLTDITDNSDRRSVLGLFNALSSLGFIFGPLISGYLANVDPTLKLSVSLGATVFAANFFLIAFCLPVVPNRVKLNGDMKDSRLSIDFSTLLKSVNIFKGIHWTELADLIFVRFLLTFTVIMFRTNFPVFLEEHFHADSTTLGKVLSFNGIIAAFSAATCGIISSHYSNRIKQLVHFSLLLAISIACLTISHNTVLLVVFLIPMAVSTSNLRICMLSLMLERGREDEKGAIIGLGNSMSSVGRMLAPSIVGVGQEYGSEVIGYVSTVLAMLAVLTLYFYPIKSRSSKET